MCLTPDIHVFSIQTTFRCFSEIAPAQPGSPGRGIKLAAVFIDSSVTKKLARMLGDFSGDLGGVPIDLPPAPRQGRSRPIPPNLDHQGATLGPVKCFEGENGRLRLFSKRFRPGGTSPDHVSDNTWQEADPV